MIQAAQSPNGYGFTGSSRRIFDVLAQDYPTKTYPRTTINTYKVSPPVICWFINPLAIVTLNRNSNVHQVRSASSLSYLGGSITKKTYPIIIP